MILSVPGLIALFVALLASAVAGLAVVDSWSEERALAQAMEQAEVISTLAVRNNLKPDPTLGLRTPNLLEAFDVQQDVNLLHADGRLVGLEVWRVDGSAVFADLGHPSSERTLPVRDGERARAGHAWVVRSSGADRGVASVDVFLPVLDEKRRGVAVMKVLLPEQELTNEIRTANRWFRGCLLALLLGVSCTLVVLRRRLATRDHQARHDALTGLLNRSALLEEARSLLQPGQSAGALLVIDLDGFKAINDTLGHAAGDGLLAQVAVTLASAVRPTDLVARLGGDEFAVLLRDLPPDGDPIRLARQVLSRLRAGDFSVEGVALAVDASIGVAVFPRDGSTVPELLQHADVAMYQAKRARSGVVPYDPSTDHHDVGQLAVLVQLREAIAQDRLVLHFQPQVCLDNGRVDAVEALVRWQHPARGLVFPDAFIPLAEPTGLMQPLTEWVLRAAIRQARSWQRAGVPLRVAVNISPRSLLEGDLPGTVLQMLADTGLPAQLLELEITETAVIGDPERAAKVLRHFAAMGVQVSMDDFGAGYSSLAHLRTLPVTTLKLDRSLITHLLQRPEDEAVVEALIRLGHRLGLQVLAEGVETSSVYQRLRQLGCDHAQGYLMSRPLAAPALEGWLAVRRSTPGFAPDDTDCTPADSFGARVQPAVKAVWSGEAT